jgi:hypothetical protein
MPMLVARCVTLVRTTFWVGCAVYLMSVEPAEPVDLEQMQAVAQVQRWHDFKAHVGAYVLINAVLIVVWALTGGGAFWPGVSLAAWGLGLSSQHFLNSFRPISVDGVRRELRRRSRRSER